MTCEPGWQTPLLAKAAKRKSTFRGENSSDMPTRYKKGTAPGRSDFLVWARMPVISYSSSPDSLYDMEKLRKSLENSECFNRDLIEQQAAAGISYPTPFYLGLVAAGAAVLYSLTRK